MHMDAQHNTQTMHLCWRACARPVNGQLLGRIENRRQQRSRPTMVPVQAHTQAPRQRPQCKDPQLNRASARTLNTQIWRQQQACMTQHVRRSTKAVRRCVCAPSTSQGQLLLGAGAQHLTHRALGAVFSNGTTTCTHAVADSVMRYSWCKPRRADHQMTNATSQEMLIQGLDCTVLMTLVQPVDSCTRRGLKAPPPFGKAVVKGSVPINQLQLDAQVLKSIPAVETRQG